MTDRHEIVFIPTRQNFRVLHISDVHFSNRTTHAENRRITEEILEKAQFYDMGPEMPEDALRAVCMTGDLVSRKYTEESFSDALILMQRLREIAPVLYSLGNHERDWPEDVRADFLARLRQAGITVLDNSSVTMEDITFTGLTLPQTVYKNEKGGYAHLTPITVETVESCIGSCIGRPQVLLAHSPMGFPAYAAWGADAVLSGHVHGGIVRIGETGLLSPERRFFPKYTKGRYVIQEPFCTMHVSAGIGKFRVNNPPEVICIDFQRDPYEEG